MTISLMASSNCLLSALPGAALVPVGTSPLSAPTSLLQAASDVGAGSLHATPASPFTLQAQTRIYVQLELNEDTAAPSPSQPLVSAIQVQLPDNNGALTIPEFLHPSGPPSLLSISASAPAATPAPPCSANGLNATVLPGFGGTGSVGASIALTNTSSGSCTLSGYPSVQVDSASGAPLISDQQDGVSSWLGAPEPSAPVVLAPQSTVSFTFTMHDMGDPGSCPSGQQMSITPPSGVGALTVPLASVACSGIITVGAFQPGETVIQ
jgi:Protein of unknown function (DUF4232)